METVGIPFLACEKRFGVTSRCQRESRQFESITRYDKKPSQPKGCGGFFRLDLYAIGCDYTGAGCHLEFYERTDFPRSISAFCRVL